MQIPKPTHVYIGRNQCGCCTAVLSIIPGDEKEIAKNVSEIIASGRYIERVEWQYYVEVVSNEETFMKCPHIEKKLEQLALVIEEKSKEIVIDDEDTYD